MRLKFEVNGKPVTVEELMSRSAQNGHASHRRNHQKRRSTMPVETKAPVETKVGGVSAQQPAPTRPEGSQSGRRIGGASPKPAHEGAAAGRAVPAAPAHSDFVWNGGPVLSCPMMYATFWGSSWTSTPSGLAEAARLSQFLQDIANSQFMNVLSQYGVGSGRGHRGPGRVRAQAVCDPPNQRPDR